MDMGMGTIQDPRRDKSDDYAPTSRERHSIRMSNQRDQRFFFQVKKADIA